MGIIPSSAHGGSGSGVIVKKYLSKPAANITRASTAIGSFSTAWTIASVVVAAGQNVELDICAYYNRSSINDPLFALFRGASQIAAWNITNLGSTVALAGRFLWIDENPGAGTYTYEVQAALFTSGTLTVYQQNPTTDVTGGSSIFTATVYTP